MDPGLEHGVAVSSNTQRFCELRVKVPILAARIGNSSHSLVAIGRGPCHLARKRPRQHQQDCYPLWVLGNRLKGFKSDLPSLSLALTMDFLSTTIQKSPNTVRVISITATTAPTARS